MSDAVLVVITPVECQLVMLNVNTGEETPTAWLPIDELERLKDLALEIEKEKPHVACQINQRWW